VYGILTLGVYTSGDEIAKMKGGSMIDGTGRKETTATNGKVLPFFLPKIRAAQGPQKAFCIPCAVRNDEFKERAPASSHTPLDATDGHRAWINGRGYELFRHPATKVLCIRCGKEVHVAYIPEEERIA
jgi:hypothetical protein